MNQTWITNTPSIAMLPICKPCAISSSLSAYCARWSPSSTLKSSDFSFPWWFIAALATSVVSSRSSYATDSIGVAFSTPEESRMTAGATELMATSSGCWMPLLRNRRRRQCLRSGVDSKELAAGDAPSGSGELTSGCSGSAWRCLVRRNRASISGTLLSSL